MAKTIDIMDIKKAVERGDIEAYIVRLNVPKETRIIIKDTKTGEGVAVGRVEDE